jgi:antitoxin component YwqK of YwqJK toxin-antitoxin module
MYYQNGNLSVEDIIQIPFQMDLKKYYEDGTLKQKKA